MYRRRIAYRCGRVPLVYTREVCAFPISNVSILDKLALVGSFNDIVNVIAKNLSYIELLQNCPRQNFFFQNSGVQSAQEVSACDLEKIPS